MLNDDAFYEYWTHLTDTDSRDKAIGRHETRFTKYFSDLGLSFPMLWCMNAKILLCIFNSLRMLKQVALGQIHSFENYDEGSILVVRS